MSRFVFSLVLATFFASGCAALVYQLVWQRYLFVGLGVDIDSVTLIVSTFMLGIGFGGACGGWLADRCPRSRLWLYAFAELALAMMGLLSPYLFSLIQSLGGAGWSYAMVCLVAVAVILIPTTVMGTTLPLLTMYFDDAILNVGVSVGWLYFVNTLGAAFGAWFAANFLFVEWGLDSSVFFAAAANLGCFFCTLLAAKFSQKRGRRVVGCSGGEGV